MSDDNKLHEEFVQKMETKFPKMFKNKNYGGFAIGKGWYHIIEALCLQINSHINWKRNQRVYDIKKLRAKRKGLDALIKFHQGSKREPSDWDIERAEEDFEANLGMAQRIEPIVIHQIKEKFGGLRFYYDGGDADVSGMVTMAEVWAHHSCETCGNVGRQRSGGWVRTLCDKHEAEYQDNLARIKNERV